MHIPDGFLSASVWVPCEVIGAGILAFGLKKTRDELTPERVPLVGVMGAFIFAAQMINFPIPGGTSGHLLGGVVAAIMLGPFVGLVAISCVLILQCLIFQDGGLTALGANIINMGAIGTLLGYAVFTAVRKVLPGKQGFFTAAFVAAWFSVVVGAAACAVELGLSGTVPIAEALIAMLGWHILIGIGEGLISMAVLSFIYTARPDILPIPLEEG